MDDKLWLLPVICDTKIYKPIQIFILKKKSHTFHINYIIIAKIRNLKLEIIKKNSFRFLDLKDKSNRNFNLFSSSRFYQKKIK